MAISRTPIEDGIDFYSKTLTRTPITKTTSNTYGDETLTEGTPITIKGAFFKRENSVNPDKPGLFNGADAILLTKRNVTINRNDKITFDGENFRVEKAPISRYLGSTEICKKSELFKI